MILLHSESLVMKSIGSARGDCRSHTLSVVCTQQTKLQNHEAWLSSRVWSHNPFPFPASITGVIWASRRPATDNFPLLFTPNCVRPLSKVAKQGCRRCSLPKLIRFCYRHMQTHHVNCCNNGKYRTSPCEASFSSLQLTSLLEILFKLGQIMFDML